MLIVPDLGDISFSSFERATVAVAIGVAATREMLDALRSFSGTDEEWNDFVARHQIRPESDLIVDEVRLENTSYLDDRVILDRIEIPTGEPLSGGEVAAAIARLSSLDWFGTITTTFVRTDGHGVLTFKVPPKPYSRNSLQFGLSLRDDFRGDTSYTLAARHQWLAINKAGGEWQNIAQIGDTAIAQTGFYQPLSWNQQWFAEAIAGYRRENVPLYIDGEQVAELERKSFGARLEAGGILWDSLELRLGAFRYQDQAEVRIGPPILDQVLVQAGGLRFQVRADSLDSTMFPRRGVEVSMGYQHEFETMGSNTGENTFWFIGSAPMSWGRDTINPTLELVNALNPVTDPFHFYFLGGFARISGLGQGELLGIQGGLARIAYYHELKRIDLGSLSQRLYVGATIEAGRTFLPGENVGFSNPAIGGGVFVGAQTLLGPIIAGFGLAEGGRHRYYFVLGERF